MTKEENLIMDEMVKAKLCKIICELEWTDHEIFDPLIVLTVFTEVAVAGTLGAYQLYWALPVSLVAAVVIFVLIAQAINRRRQILEAARALLKANGDSDEAVYAFIHVHFSRKTGEWLLNGKR